MRGGPVSPHEEKSDGRKGLCKRAFRPRIRVRGPRAHPHWALDRGVVLAKRWGLLGKRFTMSLLARSMERSVRGTLPLPT